MVVDFRSLGPTPSPRPPRPKRRPNLLDWYRAEAENSAIPLDLWQANTELVEGEQAVQILTETAIEQAQRVTSYLSKPGQRILERYQFAREGGWAATCTESPYFKPISPRYDFQKGKQIKYETASKCPALPLLPTVPSKYTTAIFDRYGVVPLVGEGFWQTVERCNIPIVITEGLKKALSLIAHGVAAIAIRGVTQWHPKGVNHLWPELAQFTGPGRQWVIAFDQDTKAKTIRDVTLQASKLGQAIKATGSEVSILGWSPEQGKGIDDVLLGLGEQASSWLSATISVAPTLDEWLKRDRKDYRLRVWRYLQSLGVEPERATAGQHLPELPELKQGAIHVLTAPTGCGKTTQLKKWVEAGYFVLALSPLNSLGKQSAEGWELPHRHDCGNSREQQEAFRLLVREANGVVSCVDSLARIQEFIQEDTPLLLVLDEADQVLESLNLGGTLKTRQGEILELFAQACEIAARNGAIVLAEATISRHSLEQIKALSGIERVRYFKHSAQRQPWPCELADGGTVENFAYELLAALRAGQKLILHTSSQNKGEVIERLVGELLPQKRVTRIDGKTNETGAFDSFFRCPDQYLKSLPELPDLLILSPSAKSGISITVPGFNEVWGLFTCHYPALWAQQLGRYRLPVPRKIFAPALIPAASADEGYCSARQVKRRLEAEQICYQQLARLAAALSEADEAKQAEQERIERIESSQREFYAAHQTSIGIQKQYPRECLTEILESWGHVVTSWRPVGSFGGSILKRIQQEIWLDDAALIAQQQPDFDADEARKRLSSSDLTRADRAAAQKVLYREEFPGVSFDSIEDCYLALTENFGRLRRGVLLQIQVANLDAYKAEQVERIRGLLAGRIKLPHAYPRGYLRALLIQKTGILDLLDGNPYQEADERVQAIKAAALHWASEIYRHFTLSIKPDQTGIEIVNKLLRKLGLKAEVLRKVGPRGQQVKIWGLRDLCSPIRVKLLKAATERAGGNPDSILSELPQSFHDAAAKTDPKPPPDPEPDGWEDWRDFSEAEDFDYLQEPDERE